MNTSEMKDIMTREGYSKEELYFAEENRRKIKALSKKVRSCLPPDCCGTDCRDNEK